MGAGRGRSNRMGCFSVWSITATSTNNGHRHFGGIVNESNVALARGAAGAYGAAKGAVASPDTAGRSSVARGAAKGDGAVKANSRAVRRVRPLLRSITVRVARNRRRGTATTALIIAVRRARRRPVRGSITTSAGGGVVVDGAAVIVDLHLSPRGDAAAAVPTVRAQRVLPQVDIYKPLLRQTRQWTERRAGAAGEEAEAGGVCVAHTMMGICASGRPIK